MTDHKELLELTEKLTRGAEMMERHEWVKLLEWFPTLRRIVNSHDALVRALEYILWDDCSFRNAEIDGVPIGQILAEAKGANDGIHTKYSKQTGVEEGNQ